MKVCLLTRNPSLAGGGIGRVSSEIRDGLIQQSHDVHTIFANNVGLVGYFKYSFFDNRFNIPKGYDVYHAITPMESIWVPKDKSVATILDIIPVVHPELHGARMGGNRVKYTIGKACFTIGCIQAAKCRFVVCISEHVRQEFIEHFKVDENKTRVIRLGIRYDLVPTPKKDKIFRVGYLGQLDRRKRVDLLVKAFRKSSIDGELVLGGRGVDENGLRELVDGDKRIKFLGFVPDDKLVDLYNSLDVFCFPTAIEGYGLPCLPPNEKINTLNGLRDISSIAIGDSVLSHNGIYRQVTSTHKRYVSEPVVEITSWSLNIPTTLTFNHPILAFKRPRKIYQRKHIPWTEQAPEWIRAGDIEVGDCVMFPIAKPIPQTPVFDLVNYDPTILSTDSQVYYKMGYSSKTHQVVKVNRYIDLNTELGRLLGYYIAEGSVNKSNKSGAEFSFGIEPEFTSETQYLIKKIFGVDTFFTLKPTKSKIAVCSQIIGTFLSRLCGVGALNKRIPNQVLYGDIGILRNLLETLHNGDGYTVGTEHSFSTSSEQLASDIVIALLRLSRKPRVKIQTRIKEAQVSKEYTVTFSSSNTENHSHSNKSWNMDGKIAFLVRKVNKHMYTGYVHNLDVDVDHSYTTRSLIAHNCVEAMACRKPVIVLKDAIIPSDVKDRCIAVDNLNIVFRDKSVLLNLYKHTDIDSNYKWARQHDWNTTIAEYTKLYREVVS